MVEIDAPGVEQELLAGKLACPECQGKLRPWGHGRRRKLRRGEEDIAVTPRRSRCRGCLRTHILLPLLAFLRRRDVAEVIGEALLRRAAGSGYRRIAALLQVPVETLRGWVARFAERAELLRSHFTRLAFLLDPNRGAIEPAKTPFSDALCAIVSSWQAAIRRFGQAPLWHFASGATGGKMINTNALFPAVC